MFEITSTESTVECRVHFLGHTAANPKARCMTEPLVQACKPSDVPMSGNSWVKRLQRVKDHRLTNQISVFRVISKQKLGLEGSHVNWDNRVE